MDELSWTLIAAIVLAYYTLSSLIIDGSCRLFFSHLRINGDRRKNPKLSQVKIGVLFVTNCLLIATAVYLALRSSSASASNLYWHKASSLLDVLIIALQLLLILFILDSNFYWTHRLVHSNKKLYRLLHAEHHVARFPNVWHTHLQNPLDYFLTTVAPLLWLSFLPIPLSFEAYLIAIVMSGFVNIAGHAGYEVTHTWLGSFTVNGLLAKFDRRRKGIARHMNNVLAHDLHHLKFNYNYSLYFSFWDRIMGTFLPETNSVDDYVSDRPLILSLIHI